MLVLVKKWRKRFNFFNVLVLISLLLLCAGCGNSSAHSEKKGRNSYRITSIQRLEIGKDFYYLEADEQFEEYTEALVEELKSVD